VLLVTDFINFIKPEMLVGPTGL